MESPAPPRATVLIVDDDPVFTSALADTLQQAGFRILTRKTGPDALKAVDEYRDAIDLAVIDILLPGMSGFEVVGAIKRRPNPIKIIVTSLVMRDLYMDVAKTFGAHAVVRKDVDFQREEWLKAVEDVLHNALSNRADQAG